MKKTRGVPYVSCDLFPIIPVPHFPVSHFQSPHLKFADNIQKSNKPNLQRRTPSSSPPASNIIQFHITSYRVLTAVLSFKLLLTFQLLLTFNIYFYFAGDGAERFGAVLSSAETCSPGSWPNR